MTKKLSYMLYSGKMSDDVYTMVPGLFQWSVAFEKFGKGGTLSADINRHSLENYDVVHVNYTPRNDSYIAAIRNALGEKSDTKIIANVDYAVGMWNSMDPHIMKAMLEKADMIFHVEPVGAGRIRSLVKEEMKKNVFTIPHPVNTTEIQKMASEDREPVIACQYHRYLDSWQDYWWGLKEIREIYKDHKVVLMNYTAPEKRGRVPIVCMFDEVLGRMKYFEYLKLLSHVKINIDITTDYTYGRGVVDAAALGVPTIGSKTIEAIRHLFMGLEVESGRDGKVKQMCINLLEDNKYYEHVANDAMKECHFYSLENSYNRMVDAICECC